MSANKMKYNQIQDMHDATKSVTVPSVQDSLDLYPQINYIEDLEFVGNAKYLSSLGNVIKILRDTPTSTTIATPDKWINSIENFQCLSGKILSSTGAPKTCATVTNSMSVFVSPGINTADGAFKDVSLSTITIDASANNDITIKFSVKYLGLSNSILVGASEFDFFRYGTTLKLLLKKISNSQYDLLLVNGSSANTISAFTNFQTLVGKWVNIVLSFSDYSDNVTYKDFYTNKLNWQVNNKLMTTTDANWAALKITTFTTMTVPKEIIALWGKGVITFNYFNGFMGIYSSKSKAASIKYSDTQRDISTKADIIDIFNGTDLTNCITNTKFDSTGLTFYCVDDYDYVFDETKYTCDMKLYKEDDGTCEVANTNCPLGFFDKTTTGDNCSCSSVDKKLMIISKNGSNNVCKSKNINSVILFFQCFILII